jgi:hypothetical protein
MFQKDLEQQSLARQSRPGNVAIGFTNNRGNILEDASVYDISDPLVINLRCRASKHGSNQYCIMTVYSQRGARKLDSFSCATEIKRVVARLNDGAYGHVILSAETWSSGFFCFPSG